MKRILFVCTGNICRSPTAEGVFRRVVLERAPNLPIEIDSAGTHDYHVGEAPDARAIAAAARRGIDLRALRARQVNDADFERFDLIVAMDRLNHSMLIERSERILAADRCPSLSVSKAFSTSRASTGAMASTLRGPCNCADMSASNPLNRAAGPPASPGSTAAACRASWRASSMPPRPASDGAA